MKIDVKILAKGVFTPELLLIALLVKDPVIGTDRKNDPKILPRPRVKISWVASTDLPFAVIYKTWEEQDWKP